MGERIKSSTRHINNNSRNNICWNLWFEQKQITMWNTAAGKEFLKDEIKLFIKKTNNHVQSKKKH